MSYDQLKVLAESYHDAQKLRIATEHRIRHTPAVPEALMEHVANLTATEKLLARGMKRSFKDTAPDIYTWTIDTVGLGEHSMARLLGAIGDPIHAEPWVWMEESPEDHECSYRCGKGRHLVALEPFDRTARQLLAYCGHGDPSAKRRKGMSQEDTLALGNPVAKMLLHLLAESCIKQMGSGAPVKPNSPTSADDSPVDGGTVPLVATELVPDTTLAAAVVGSAGGDTLLPDELDPYLSAKVNAAVGDLSTDDGLTLDPPAKAQSVRRRSPYRDAYDQTREKYADREDWTDAHKHNASIRYTAKQIGVDLWRVASGLPPRWKSEDGL